MTEHVIVVGAGPAGRACAATLAEAGRTVTLVERHLKPGTKSCAGGIPRSAWGDAQLDRYDDVILARHDRLCVKSPWGRTVLRQPDPFLAVIDRPAWAAAQLEQLDRLGVRLALGTRVLAFTRTGVETTAGDLDCDTIVGADGSSSRIRRLLGLGPARIRISAFQITTRDLPSESQVHLNEPTVWFDPRRFASGYGWCFPAGDTLRIGCGARIDELSPRQLRASFTEWLDTLLPDSHLPHRVRGASIACAYAGHRFGRIFLAGDAAGLASPLTGEGIAQGILSGREVAREIIDGSYRSPLIPKLAIRHQRTCAGLHIRAIGSPAYLLAPHLLRWPRIKRFVHDKYVL